MSTLSLKQLLQRAERQPSGLTEDERIVFSYLEAKVHYGVEGLTPEARIAYEQSCNLIGMQVKTIDRKPL